jgi:GNAT superfamily N-acetyltransferase
VLTERWGSPQVACLGGLYDACQLDGFVADLDGTPSGLVTYRVDDDGCEVVTLDSLASGHGIGAALLEAVAEEARKRGCRRVWLTTTNDNLPALRFYQRIGWELVALHRDAAEEMRRLKPSISLTGLDGIPIRHALELELSLSS